MALMWLNLSGCQAVQRKLKKGVKTQKMQKTVKIESISKDVVIGYLYNFLQSALPKFHIFVIFLSKDFVMG